MQSTATATPDTRYMLNETALMTVERVEESATPVSPPALPPISG
jgi:hypothetical protein